MDTSGTPLQYVYCRSFGCVLLLNQKRNKEQTICITGYYNMGLFIAMETFKILPLAEVRQIINYKIDLQLLQMK